MKVERCIDYLIVPFNYSQMFIDNSDLEQEYKKILKQINETGLWDGVTYSFDSRLYSHITSTISILEDYDLGSIGTCYKLKKDKKIRVSNNIPTGALTLSNNKSTNIDFKIGEIQLNLFKTGIGFLVVEVVFNEDADIETVVEANYLLKRIRNTNYSLFEVYNKYKIDGKRVLFTDKEGENTFIVDDKLVNITFNDPRLKENTFKPVLNFDQDKQELILYYDNNIAFRDIVMSLLEDIPEVSYFSYSNKGEEKLPERCLPFSCVIVEDKERNDDLYEEVIGKQLFNLRHSYKNSYLPAPEKLSLKDNKEVVRLFENSFWGVSKEGCSNIVVLRKDKGNGQFFKGNYLGNIKNDYMFLYILALHQYFGLLGFAMELATLPADTAKYTEDDITRLDTLSMRMGFFNLKTIFSEVSFITHQQDIYDKVREILGIKDLVAELREESVNIQQILKHYHDELNEKRISRFSWIGSIFAVLAIVQSLWDLVGSYDSGNSFATEFTLKYPNMDFIITILFLISVAGAAIGLAVLFKKGIMKVIKALKGEK